MSLRAENCQKMGRRVVEPKLLPVQQARKPKRRLLKCNYWRSKSPQPSLADGRSCRELVGLLGCVCKTQHDQLRIHGLVKDGVVLQEGVVKQQHLPESRPVKWQARGAWPSMVPSIWSYVK